MTHTTEEKQKTEWNTEMKIKLLLIDKEEREKGRGFMRRIKEQWDTYYPKHATAYMQKLTDNASQFKKKPEITNLLLVRKRNQVDHHQKYKQREWGDQDMVQEYEVTQDDETAVTDVNDDVDNEQRLRNGTMGEKKN